jgi:predicted nucleic acid-binding protein
MKIYLDVCCFNRPFDDFSQTRIRIEAEAILSILARCDYGDWVIAASDVIEWEISKLPDIEKLEKVVALYRRAKEYLPLTDEIKKRAVVLQGKNLKAFDSLHLALAETNGYDVLLTTDDDFLKMAAKIELSIKVANPAFWIMKWG